MLANALLWCSSNDLSARLSRLKPAGASLSVPSVFAALLGVMAAPLKGDPELKPLGRSLYDKYLGEMEVINKGIGTLLEEHWDARGRGIEERESLLDTWENQLRTRQWPAWRRSSGRPKMTRSTNPRRATRARATTRKGCPRVTGESCASTVASTIAHAKDRAGATPTAFTTVGNVTRTGSSTGTKAATGNRRRLPKAARAARAARASSHADESAGFRLLIMMKTTAMSVPLCPQVLKVGMHAHSSDSFRRVALSTESSSGMQQL